MSDEFRDFLYERSEGNPFVVEEMLRDALDRGDIFPTDSGWDRKALGEIRIPRTVRDTILHRRAAQPRRRLGPLGRLGCGPVIRPLDADGGDRDRQATVLAALEACVTNQLLEEEDRNSAKYRFPTLSPEAVYEDMVVPRRQQLHARVAEVLDRARTERPWTWPITF